MVDEYSMQEFGYVEPIVVQIPLWSMNTSTFYDVCCGRIRSDSSMVDEYDMSKKLQVVFEDVQIPLWSMNTFHQDVL